MDMYTFCLFDDDLEFLDVLCKEISFILEDIDVVYRIVKNPSANSIHLSETNLIFFLDIEMPQINGLDLGKILRQKFPNCILIYISSYDDYVFDSFESEPYAFIQKSKYKERTFEVLKRYFNENLNVFIFKFNNTEIKVRYTDIFYIRKFTNNIEIVTNKQVFKYRDSLEHIENHLNKNSKVFIRIHRSFLVNLKKICN